MRTRALLLLLLSCVCRPSGAAEQTFARGERMRLTITAGERLTGRLTETTPDSMVIELEEDGGLRSISTQDLASIETRRGRTRGGGAWHKAKWGALIGAVSGTTLGLQHDQVGEDGTSVGEAVALGVWSGFVMGGLIGAAVGALSPGEEWVDVSASVRSGIDPGFSLSVRFEF